MSLYFFVCTFVLVFLFILYRFLKIVFVCLFNFFLNFSLLSVFVLYLMFASFLFIVCFCFVIPLLGCSLDFLSFPGGSDGKESAYNQET